MQNVPRGVFCIGLTVVKLPFVIKIFVSSIFEWLYCTGFTVHTCEEKLGDKIGDKIISVKVFSLKWIHF